MKLTELKKMILKAVNSKPGEWLNCHGNYIGEALALQCTSGIETQIGQSQLQIRMPVRCERCDELSQDRFCDDCMRLPNNEFYSAFYPPSAALTSTESTS